MPNELKTLLNEKQKLLRPVVRVGLARLNQVPSRQRELVLHLRSFQTRLC